MVKADSRSAMVLIFTAILGVLCVTPACSRITRFFSLGAWYNREAAKQNAVVNDFSVLVRPVKGNAHSHYLLANYYYERRKYEEAIKEFEKTVAIQPDHVKAYNGIAVCYDRSGQYTKALRYYEMALKLAPNADYLHNNLGYSYMLQGKYELAVQAYSKAVAINSQKALFHANLSMAYSRIGLHQQAARESELAQHAASESAIGSVDSGTVVQAHASGDDSRLAARVTKLPAKSAAIEIANGNGINNMARNMAAYLKDRGFNVIRCTNADKFDYPKSYVHYVKEARDAGDTIAREIKEIEHRKEVNKLDRPNIKVKILIGRDLVARKSYFEEG